MSTRPQTIGSGLTDTPVGLAAWMLDHDTDSYEKISHALLDGQPSGGLTRDRIVDNITLYWLTNTATSAARLYWEDAQASPAARPERPPGLSLPVAFTGLPRRDLPGAAELVEKAYPNLIYFHEAERGGHFAAWEQPQLFSEELRAAFRSLR